MKTLIKNCHLISPDVDLKNAAILIDGAKIAAIYPAGDPLPEADQVIDAAGAMTMPGFVDVHCHGRSGVDFCDATDEAMTTFAVDKLKEGVTTLLPTTLTLPEDQLAAALQTARNYVEAGSAGCKVPAVHLEGPFLSYEKRGAQKAEALQSSTDWKATTEKLAALQREWKTIGAVPKKQSDAIWKRFNTACDIFFDNRKAATSSQRTEEQQNLDKKKAVIEALSAINSENPTAEDQAKMHDLIKEWNSIGHVPFKEKDKVYKQYKALIDTLFGTFRKNEATKKVARYKESIKEGTNIARERERLLRIYENMCGEIKTYENNLGFLNASSKSGNSLVAEMQRKMEKLKDDAQLVLKKIAALEDKEEK